MTKNKKSSGKFIKLFVPELRQIAGGDEKTWLMMAQLEYWFGKKPDGLYKFKDKPKEPHKAYKDGDSWAEEMGFSTLKIDNALKPICTHYGTFGKYKEQKGDKFQGNYYLSYYHKPSHLTYYLRNHDVVNEKLASISLEETSSIFRAKHSSQVGKESNVSSGNWESDVPEVEESNVMEEEKSYIPEYDNQE